MDFICAYRFQSLVLIIFLVLLLATSTYLRGMSPREAREGEKSLGLFIVGI